MGDPSWAHHEGGAVHLHQSAFGEQKLSKSAGPKIIKILNHGLPNGSLAPPFDTLDPHNWIHTRWCNTADCYSEAKLGESGSIT
jgi:hypothetical protein